MWFLLVYIVVCVLKSILGCDKLYSPVSLVYRNGDILDLEITHLSFSTTTKAYEFVGQICNTFSFLPFLVTHMTATDNKFWKIVTLFEKIDTEQNICSYYTTMLESNKQRQMQLFELEYDRDRSPDNTTPKTFHYNVTVDWVKFCFDAEEVTERVPKQKAVAIEGEVGHEIEYVCKPDNIDQPSTIHFFNNQPVIIASEAERKGRLRYLRMNLHEFDNNTYMSCGNRPSAYEFENPKWSKIKVKPSEISSDVVSNEKLYEYQENEVYELECVGHSRMLYYMKVNEGNEIVSSASSNEYFKKLVKRFRLSRNDHNSKLMCMAIECKLNITEQYYNCSREELSAVKFVMKRNAVQEIVPSDKCQLPAYPPDGTYQVFNSPNAVPFQISDFWIVDVKCDVGYGIVDGEKRLFCVSGVWSPSPKLPKCVPFCKLIPHPSVKYNCKSLDSGLLFTRTCEEYEPPGMLAVAECKKPDYISNDELPIMRCTPEGIWSSSPTCMAACGEVTPGAMGRTQNVTKLGQMPWHVGIYQKTSTPYEQVCGGSIVRPSVVISAAHCFWDDKLSADQKLRPASDYAVAAGKMYRPWDDTRDKKYAQKADVIFINVPSKFHGSSNNYMDDLAVLLLSKSFQYKKYIVPVCLNFDEYFDRIQVTKGMIGKVAGWGGDSPGGDPSPELKVVDLQIVPNLKCYDTSPISFRRFVTADKICASYKNKDTAVCTGDSGGGLVVAGNDRGVTRYYLRGVVSTAPKELSSCRANEITTFTHVILHYGFIKSYLLL